MFELIAKENEEQLRLGMKKSDIDKYLVDTCKDDMREDLKKLSKNKEELEYLNKLLDEIIDIKNHKKNK